MIHQKLLLFVSMLLCCSVAFSQERTITGKVTDDSTNAPLAGVSVHVRGTSGGTSTNSEGVFSIKAPGGAVTLVFSYIGYGSKEVASAAGANELTVSMANQSKQ